jgi:hypothetical protein
MFPSFLRVKTDRYADADEHETQIKSGLFLIYGNKKPVL